MPRRPTPEEMLRDLLRQLGARGGRARIQQLTPEERTALARKAGKASGAARRAKGRKGR
jgi:hypothetical protein